MVKIEFNNCEYKFVECIDLSGKTINFPLVQYADILANNHGGYNINYYYDDEDGKMYIENATPFNIETKKDYIKNGSIKASENGRIIFELDVDEYEFDSSKVTIYANVSDKDDLNGLILDHIYYDGKTIEHPHLVL